MIKEQVWLKNSTYCKALSKVMAKLKNFYWAQLPYMLGLSILVVSTESKTSLYQFTLFFSMAVSIRRRCQTANMRLNNKNLFSGDKWSWKIANKYLKQLLTGPAAIESLFLCSIKISDFCKCYLIVNLNRIKV